VKRPATEARRSTDRSRRQPSAGAVASGRAGATSPLEVRGRPPCGGQRGRPGVDRSLLSGRFQRSVAAEVRAAAFGRDALRTATNLSSTITLERLHTLQRQVAPLRSASPHLTNLDDRITDHLTHTTSRPRGSSLFQVGSCFFK
jgi:hypothetical protein